MSTQTTLATSAVTVIALLKLAHDILAYPEARKAVVRLSPVAYRLLISGVLLGAVVVNSYGLIFAWSDPLWYTIVGVLLQSLAVHLDNLSKPQANPSVKEAWPGELAE